MPMGAETKKIKAPLVAERSLQYKILTYYETLIWSYIVN